MSFIPRPHRQAVLKTVGHPTVNRIPHELVPLNLRHSIDTFQISDGDEPLVPSIERDVRTTSRAEIARGVSRGVIEFEIRRRVLWVGDKVVRDFDVVDEEHPRDSLTPIAVAEVCANREG